MFGVRRFYFDDGRSRKRWHVQVQGKMQIVQYGRLGGSLRESTKSFKSPAEAKERTEKLIATKSREGYHEIDLSRLEIVEAKGRRKATEKQIQTLEKQIGCGLPDEYREFLKTVNGGHPNPDCVDVPGVAGIDKLGVGPLFHLQPSKPVVDELSYEFERARALLPEGHLPIAGSSDLFTLSLKPKSFGAVHWWFHETDDVDDDGNYLDSAGYLLAGSFDEFLTRIALVFGDDAELESTSPSGTTKKKPKATVKRLLALVKHDHTPEKVKDIEQVVKELGDLSDIEDGKWPFINIRNPRVLRCLLEAGLNPEITDTDQHSLLWQSAGHRECVDLLLERGVKVDRRSGGDFETALMRAMYLQDIPAAKRLLQAGANPTLRMEWPITHKLKNNADLRKLIEKAQADWRNNRSKTQLAKAMPLSAPPTQKRKGPKPSVKRLLRLMRHDYIPEEGEEFDAVEGLIIELGDLSGIQDGEWPAIDKFEDARLLSALLETGLRPEITDKKGYSLLRQCASHPNCIDLLVERGVDVNRRSGRNDETALMRATYAGDEECVQRLLKAGADPTLEFSPFAKVMLSMDEEMSARIEAARADWNRNNDKRKRKKATAKKK